MYGNMREIAVLQVMLKVIVVFFLIIASIPPVQGLNAASVYHMEDCVSCSYIWSIFLA